MKFSVVFLIFALLKPFPVWSANLSEQCQTNGDCLQAFSYCHINRCQCRENFLERQNRCVPQKYYCRFGHALLSTSGDVVHCHIISPSSAIPLAENYGVYEKTWPHGQNSTNESIVQNAQQKRQLFANANFGYGFQQPIPFDPHGQNPWTPPFQPVDPVGSMGPFYPQPPFGQGPNGQGQFGQWSLGQGLYGQGPYGQGPNGQGPFGQGPTGQGPYGQGPNGQGPFGQGPYGQGSFPGPFGPGLPTPYPAWPEHPQKPQCYQQIDTCPKDYYCVTYFNNALSVASGGRTIRLSGFCCPNPPPACPVGEPWMHSDSSCNNCPTETYFCYTDRKYGTKACCPKACNDGMTFYPDDGQCRPAARLGDQCDRDDQCGYPNSRCIIYNGRKRCGCAYGYVAVAQLCVVARCPSSNQQPLIDMYGELTRCGSLFGDFGRCPLGYGCDAKLGVCCGQPSTGQGFPYPGITPGFYPSVPAGTCPNFTTPITDPFGSPIRCPSQSCPAGSSCNMQSGLCCPTVNPANFQCPTGSTYTGQTCNAPTACSFGASCVQSATNGFSESISICCRSQINQGINQCPNGYYPRGRGCTRSDECRQYGYAYCMNGQCCTQNPY